MNILNFTEDHHQFRQRLRAFLAADVVPYIEAFEAAHQVPKSLWAKMGQNGFLCTCVSPEYGGPGGDFLYSAIVSEELARIHHTGLAASLHSDIVVPYIDAFGTPAQKQKYLPGCVTGDIVTAVAMTEPDAGSDVAAMATTAVEQPDAIVINGTKTFISNGVNCDLVVLAAKDPAVENRHQAVSLYLVEADTPGFKKGRPLEKMGWRSQDTAELFFTNCKIPIENRLGQAGMGFLMLMEKLQQERLVCAMGAVFGAESMLEWTTQYLKRTPEIGKPLIKAQATQFAVVEMASEVKLGKIFIEKLIADHMDGAHIVVETCMAKYWSTDMAKRIAHRCLDLIGPFATLEACPIARAWRDIRVTSIFAGTNEIMKSIVAKGMGI